MVGAKDVLIGNAEFTMNQFRTLPYCVPGEAQYILGVLLPQMLKCVVCNGFKLICNLHGRVPWNV